MIYLIGVDHKVQTRENMNSVKEAEINKYLNHLEEQIKKYGINFIAEEFNAEQLQMRGMNKTTTKEIAEKLNISHRLCDPTSKEVSRENTNIHDLKEEHWLNKILDIKNSQAIFVCGGEHVDTFHAKLKIAGISVKILSKGWGDDLAGRNIYTGEKVDWIKF